MSPPSTLPAAIRDALQAGRKQEARRLLETLLQEDPQNYRAWLWLAGLTPSPRASLNYIRQAQKLNPDDPTVARARAWAEERLVAAEAETQPESAPTASPTEPEPAPTAEALVQRLRERHEPESESRGAQRLLLALGVLGLLVIIAASLWTWGDTLLAMMPWNDAPVEAVAATQPTVAAPTATSDTGTSDRFVSGQFAPKLSGSGAAEDPTPQATATATTTAPPLQPKASSEESDNDEPRPTWTMTPSPTNTPTPTPTPAPTFVSEDTTPSELVVRPAGVGPNERWVDVNLTTQRLVAYEGNTPVFDSLVSSGTWQHPTVTGQFRVWLRYTAQTMDGRRLGYDYYLPNVPYVMYFYEDYALHGTYWHNNFGTPMSHGCVNLPTPAAEWIFNWSSIGTVVNVHY